MVRRADHRRQHRRRVLRHDLRDRRVAEREGRSSGPAATTAWSTSRATAGKTWTNVTAERARAARVGHGQRDRAVAVRRRRPPTSWSTPTGSTTCGRTSGRRPTSARPGRASTRRPAAGRLPPRGARGPEEARGCSTSGTERGVMFSPDDGATWKPLKLNLPTVAVHDLVVKDDDLVRRHARPLDLDPRRPHAAPRVVEGRSRRRRRTSSRRGRPCAGATTGPISSQVKGPGENPPAGAVAPLLAEGRAEGRRRARDPRREGRARPHAQQPEARAGDADGRSRRGEDEPRRRPLPKKAGLQRAVWDLRYEGAHEDQGGQDRLGRPGRRARWRCPAPTRLRLTVDGQTLTTPLEVRLDPRVTRVARPTSRSSSAFALALRDDLTRLTGIVHDLRSVREQVTARARVARGRGRRRAARRGRRRARWRSATRSRQKLHNPKAEVDLRHPGHAGRGEALLAPRAALLSWARDGDGRPTQGMRDVYAELKERARRARRGVEGDPRDRRAGPQREGPRAGPGLRRAAGRS